MTVGAPAGGMNPATKACVRSALNQGHSVLAINDGFDGLVRRMVCPNFVQNTVIIRERYSPNL